MLRKRLAISSVVLFCASLSLSQVAVTPAPVPKLQFLDQNGKPLAAGCVFTYAAGTTNQQATYNSNTGTQQNSNPVILDSAGRASIWITSQSYKFVVFSAGGIKCASGVQQYSIDGISQPLLSSVNSITSAASNPATAGFIRMANGDLVNWRNVANAANIGFAQAGAATAATGNVADVIQYGDSSHGAWQAQRYLDFSSAPAQSGIFATGNNVCGLASRNAAGNGDVCAVQVNASNMVALGGLAETSFISTDSITSNPLGNGGSTGWKYVLNGSGATAYAVGVAPGTEVHSLPSGGSWFSIFSSVSLPNLDGSSTAPDTHAKVSLGTNGTVVLGSVVFASLPSAVNGSMIYCSDCNSTCTAGASTGRTCFRENGAWTH